MNKKTASSIGIILGIAIIIVGFCVQGISIEIYHRSIGRDIAFGADFYTEMYDVTRDVGYAVNGTKTAIAEAAEGVCDAIGWLIVAIGLVDIAYFVYKMSSFKVDAPSHNNSDLPTTAPASLPVEPVVKPMEQKENTISRTATTHKWRCANCGQMTSKSPCEYCGYDENATKAPYRCGKCGQAGPYDENCPTCGSSLKFYNH